MTKRINLFLLSIALILAFLTTAIVMKTLARWQTAHAEKTAPVVVVLRQVPDHQVVTSSDVILQQVPVNGVETGTYQTLEQVVGHYTSTTWFPGQQVLSPMLLADTQAAAFPLSIPLGQRAFTIADDPIIGVDHLASPGDRVDVLVTYSDSKEEGPIVSTLLQNILVLHVDNAPIAQLSGTAVVSGASSTTTQGQSGVDTLTLAVTMQQAEALQFATAFGRIHIVLRNPNDGGNGNQTMRVLPVTPGAAALTSP